MSGDSVKKVIRNIKLTEEENRQLAHEAHQHDMNVSEYIRWLIKKESENTVRGHWIDKFAGEYRCSICRKIIIIDEIEHPNGITFKFCPYCGSKMDL